MILLVWLRCMLVMKLCRLKVWCSGMVSVSIIVKFENSVLVMK